MKHSSKQSAEYHYTVVLEPCPEGGFTVIVPALPGCITEGNTKEEALRNAREAILLHLEGMLADGEPLPADVLPLPPIVESIKIVA